MLTFNLKKKWYEKILRGEKKVEYREVKPYWNKRIRNELVKYFKCDKNHPFFLQWNRMHNTWDDGEGISTHCVGRDVHAPLECRLVLGYTKRYMTAIITRIEVVDGKYTDLAIDKPVYAIHLANVREAE